MPPCTPISNTCVLNFDNTLADPIHILQNACWRLFIFLHLRQNRLGGSRLPFCGWPLPSPTRKSWSHSCGFGLGPRGCKLSSMLFPKKKYETSPAVSFAWLVRNCTGAEASIRTSTPERSISYWKVSRRDFEWSSSHSAWSSSSTQ